MGEKLEQILVLHPLGFGFDAREGADPCAGADATFPEPGLPFGHGYVAAG
jgi:hypothetical protein